MLPAFFFAQRSNRMPVADSVGFSTLMWLQKQASSAQSMQEKCWEKFRRMLHLCDLQRGAAPNLVTGLWSGCSRLQLKQMQPQHFY